MFQKGEVVADETGRYVCIHGDQMWPGGVSDISLWKKEGSDKLWLQNMDGSFRETAELVINYL
jgi:hypothetical protein